MSPAPAHPLQPGLAPARTYTIPKVSGDAAAVYRLADAYRQLGEAVGVAQRLVAHVVADLSGSWRGHGHQASHAPVETFAHNARALAAALEQAANELEAYAHRLATAHHHHGWSLRKVLTVGAIVTVSAVAIVVTVGAASVVEAAAATAAVESATEAAGAAEVAGATAAGDLDTALDALSWLKPLLAFVVPHLLDAEWAAAGMATYDEITTNHVPWRSVAETAGVAFLASKTAGKATALVGDSSAAAPHVIQGSAWAGAAAGDDELLEHHVDPLDVMESFVLTSGGGATRDILREHGLWIPPGPDYRREAILAAISRGSKFTDAEVAHEAALLRETPRELRAGDVNLALHEGPGHTIDRHISKSAEELLARIRTDRRIPVASTYWNETEARDAIATALRGNAKAIDRWMAAGGPDTLRLRVTEPHDLGFAIDRRGTVRFTRQAIVVLQRDHAGVFVRTSYPVSPRGR